MQSTSIPFTFQQPGTARPGDKGRSTNVKVKEHTKRCGLIPMRPGSQHVMPIGDHGQNVTARDRRAFPHASGKFFCTHRACAGKFHDTIEQLQKAHEPQTVLEQRGEIHLYGFWSNDPCNTKPEKGCEDCAPKGKDGKAPPEPKACAEHQGGVIGLLTPTDPHAAS